MQAVDSTQNFSILEQVTDGLIGGTFLLIALENAQTFFQSFKEPKPVVQTSLRRIETTRSRIETRVLSFVNFTGVIAQFLDWGHERNWFVVTFVNLSTLKVVGYFTGVLRYLMYSLETLDQLAEVDRLSELDHHQWHLYQPGEFNLYRYSLWLNFFSNLTFCLGSGAQCASWMMGTVLVGTTLNFLLTAGIACWVCSFVLQKIDGDRTMQLDRLRTLDPKSQYSFVTTSQVASTV